MRLAVFASGGGSNFGAMLEAIEAGMLDAAPVLVVADRPGTGAAEKAAARGVPVAVLPLASFAGEAAWTEALLDALARSGATHVALAGFLKKVPEAVVAAFRHRMLNVHPALLPAFGGRGYYGERVHQAVLDHGCRVSGATVHLVDPEYDTGPIILQEPVPVLQGDTVRALAGRVLEVEHRIYPRALQLFATGRVRVEGRRVVIRDDVIT